MTRTKAKQAAPTVAEQMTELNLRLGFWTDHSGMPRTPEQKDSHWWCESRARVWFDHKIIAWRAFDLGHEHGFDNPGYMDLCGSVGYDPMDAVDQLAFYSDYTTRALCPVPSRSWTSRRPMETDRQRGYVAGFPINPYNYTLEASYQATVVEAGRGYIAYLEKDDGRVFVGAADNAIHAVAAMEADMACTDCSQTLRRIPGTDITVPLATAVDLGLVEDEPPISGLGGRGQ